MRHILFLGTTLTLLWLALSGFFTPLMLSFGVFSVLLVGLIVHRMDVVDHEGHPLHLRPLRLLLYWCWLLKEIVVSNIAVARIILSPKMPISPTVIKVNVSQLSEVGQVNYGNSVTLTPGSLTMSLDPSGDVTIHTLTRETAAEIQQGELAVRLAKIEEGHDRGASD